MLQGLNKEGRFPRAASIAAREQRTRVSAFPRRSAETGGFAGAISRWEISTGESRNIRRTSPRRAQCGRQVWRGCRRLGYRLRVRHGRGSREHGGAAAPPLRPPVEAALTPFEAMTSLACLYDAWERVRANKGCAGGDGVTIATFSAGLGDRLLQLHRALRTGHYFPGTLRQADIPKPDGGVRTLAIPGIADRVAQTAAMLILGPQLEPEMHDASFAYRKGRSAQQAVMRIAAYRRRGYGWVVDGDISAFFDDPHDQLIQRLGRSIKDPLLIELFRLWLDSFSETGAGIAQGSPISPLLANLYLTDIDAAIDRQNCRLVRFADDFVLLCRTREGAQAALAHIGELLVARGLRLHPDKTRIVPFDKAFSFLGRLFVRSLVLGDPARKAKRKSAPPAATVAAAGAACDEEEIARGAPGLRVLSWSARAAPVIAQPRADRPRPASRIAGAAARHPRPH